MGHLEEGIAQFYVLCFQGFDNIKSFHKTVSSLLQNLSDYDMSLVKKYGKVFGYYDGPQPNLWITDLELIKATFVKDFDHIVDRRVSNKTFKNKLWYCL